MSEGNGGVNPPPVDTATPPAVHPAPFVTVRMTQTGVELDTNIVHPKAVEAALLQGLAAVALKLAQPPPPTIHKPNGGLFASLRRR